MFRSATFLLAALLLAVPVRLDAGQALAKIYYLQRGWRRYPLVRSGEPQMGYFAGRDPAQPAVAYRVVRAGLVDTASSRRALVELFKPALLGTGARLDFSRWLALPEGGYCFATSAATPAMAMDFRTEEGTITGVVVGPVSDCATAQPDLELEQRFRDRRRAGTDAGC